MSDHRCVVCSYHYPGADGECTSSCRHTRAKVGLVCSGCAQTVRLDMDAIGAAYRFLASHPAGSSTASSSGSERGLPGGGRLPQGLAQRRISLRPAPG